MHGDEHHPQGSAEIGPKLRVGHPHLLGETVPEMDFPANEAVEFVRNAARAPPLICHPHGLGYREEPLMLVDA